MRAEKIRGNAPSVPARLPRYPPPAAAGFASLGRIATPSSRPPPDGRDSRKIQTDLPGRKVVVKIRPFDPNVAAQFQERNLASEDALPPNAFRLGGFNRQLRDRQKA